jgi:hypothetical protein
MKREIKIAIIVSSRYRKYSEICLDIFNKYFNYNDNEINVTADFFVHTHEKTCEFNYDKTKWLQNSVTSQNIDDINNILKPKKLVIETNYDCISSKLKSYVDNKYVFWCADEKYSNDFQRLYQYHSFEEGVKLMTQYEIENNITYDFAFKMRPDLFIKLSSQNGYIFKFPFLWERDYSDLTHKDAQWAKNFRINNTVFVHDLSVACGYPKICDTTFYSSSVGMRKFTENFTVQIVKNLIRVYTDLSRNEPMRDTLLTPESIIVNHIVEKNINLVSIPNGLHSTVCIRPNYISGSDFIKTCELYNQFAQGEKSRLMG